MESGGERKLVRGNAGKMEAEILREAEKVTEVITELNSEESERPN